MKVPIYKKFLLSWSSIVIAFLGLAFLIDYIPDGKLDMLAYLLHFIHNSHLFCCIDNLVLIDLLKLSLFANYYFIVTIKLLCNYAFMIITYVVLLILSSTDISILARICSFIAHIPFLSYFKQQYIVIKAFENLP